MIPVDTLSERSLNALIMRRVMLILAMQLQRQCKEVHALGLALARCRRLQFAVAALQVRRQNAEVRD